MDAQVQLVFFGEVLEGFRLEDVKRELGQLLKLDEAQQAQLFSGARAVLKRSVDAAQAQRYVEHLAHLGARLHVEPMPRPAEAPAVPAESQQQVQDEREARAARLAEWRATRGLPPLDEAAVASEDGPPTWGLGFAGRMARLPYATAGGYLMTALYLLTLFMLQRPDGTRGVLFVLGLLAIVVMAIRQTALRLHDCNRSGWWSLLLAVPYLGGLMGLVLTFAPGTRGENDHGGAARKGSWLMWGLSVVVFALAVGLSWGTAKVLWQQMQQGEAETLPTSTDMVGAAPLPSARARTAFENEYAGAPGHKAFAVSASGAWGWASGAGSTEQAVLSALANCEARREPYTARCVPVNVDGAWVSPR